MKLDLSSQKDIKRFVSEINGRFAKVHFLVNNAGVLSASVSDDGTRRKNTEDGFETTMATNYFGTFALTELLLDKVVSSGVPSDPSRIVHVSSAAHLDAKVTPEFDLDSFANDAFKQYSISKLLVNLSCKSLSLQLKGTHTEVACLHPGNFQRPKLKKYYCHIIRKYWEINIDNRRISLDIIFRYDCN